MSENMEASEHSENLYGYQDSESNKNNEPPKESNAIRRSIGTGENPFHFQDHNSFQPQENEQSQENKIDLRKPPSTIQEEYNPPKPKPTNYIKPQSLTTSKSISNNNSNTEPCPKSSIIFLFLLMLQILAVVILATAYKRGDGDPNNFGKNDDNEFGYYFNFLKDVHLMIFIGLGLLYCSLKDYQKSSISLVLFLGMISFEFSLLWNYFWNNAMRTSKHMEYGKKWNKLKLNIEEITQIDFFSATILISLGAIIGKLSLGQYLLVVLFETFFASLNYYICYFAIGGLDTGGSVYIFTFGALYGFCISFVLSYDNRYKNQLRNNLNNRSSYYSNVISAVGSLFLWIYFPSFNTARVHCKHDNENNVMEIMRYRGIINTYMSMLGSTVTSLCMSSLLNDNKFKIDHILKSSYVGGVIIAGSCTFCAYPWCALLIGNFGGVISVVLLHYSDPKKIVPILDNQDQPLNPQNNIYCFQDFINCIKTSDSIGVMYCFGIPGILGGICTAIFLACLGKKPWKNELKDFFYFDRSASVQGGIQIATLFITITIAILVGTSVGFILRCFDFGDNDYLFVDRMIFEERRDKSPFEFVKYNNKNPLSSSENKLNNDEQGGEEGEGENQENNIDNNNNIH